MSRFLLLCLTVTVAALTCVRAAQVPTIESLRTGTASISGRVLDGQTGEALGNVRVALTAPRFPRIANRILSVRISAPGSDAGPIQAWLYRIEPRMTRQIALNAEGAGRVPGLLEGRYFVAAHAQGDNQGLAAFEIVHLIEDAVELPMLLQQPGRISGRLVSEKGGVPPLAGVRVAASWTDEGELIDPLAADEVEVASDGGFRLNGLFGMRTLRVTGLPPGWKVLSMRQGRSEISPAGVDVGPGTVLDLVVTVGQR